MRWSNLLLILAFLTLLYTCFLVIVRGGYDKEWNMIYEGNEDDLIYDIAIDDQGNIIAVGCTEVNGNYDNLIIKYNPDGDILWAKSYGTWSGEKLHAVVIDKNNDIVIGGEKGRDIYIAKISSDGRNVLWEKTISGESLGCVYDLDIDFQNNIVLAGKKSDNFYIAKISENGDFLWNASVDNGYLDSATGIKVDSNNNIIVAGYTYVNGTYSWCISKYSASGHLVWLKSYDINLRGKAYGIDIDSNDDIVIVGTLSDTSSGNDICIVKCNGDGEVLWSTIHERNGNDYGTDVTIDPNGNIIVVGYLYRYADDTDIFIGKYTKDGQIVWYENYDSGYHGKEYGYSVAVNGKGDIFIGGIVEENSSSLGDFDGLILKYGFSPLSPQASFSYSPYTVPPNENFSF